jgi:hypothetical protein
MVSGGNNLELLQQAHVGFDVDEAARAEDVIYGEVLSYTAEQIGELFEGFKRVSEAQFERDSGKTGDRLGEGDWGNSAFFDRKVAYLPPEGEAIFVGDTHGDVESTLTVIRDSGFLEAMAAGEKKYMVFMGDYVDRGRYSVENLSVVLRLKTMFPENVAVLQGNHERREKLERGVLPLENRYVGKLNDLARDFMQDYVVAGNGIFAVHGGIPVVNDQGRFRAFDSLKMANAFYFEQTEDEVPYSRLPYFDPRNPMYQCQWNGFHNGGGVVKSERGEGVYMLGGDVLGEFLEDVGCSVVFHAHDANRNEFIPGKELLVFSAGGHEGSDYSADKNRGYYTVDLSAPMVDVVMAQQHLVV